MWIRLLRIGGIAVYVDVLVLALIALVFLGGEGRTTVAERLLLIGIALASVLLHELGHAAMARVRGLRVSGVFLHLIPFAYVERGKPADELRVALAGPAVNIVLAGVLFALPAVHGGFPWMELDRWLDDPWWSAFGINAAMGVLNLIPALPVDGGRALRAALLLRMAPGTAYSRTARVGTFVGAALLVLAVILWPSSDALLVGTLGAFFILVAWREAAHGQLERQIERSKSRQKE